MQRVSEKSPQKKVLLGADAKGQPPGQAGATAWRFGEETKKILLRNEAGVVLMLAVICIVTAMLTPRFLTADNLMNVLQQSVLVGILSLGQLLVIVTAGIDLSVGSLLALASAIFALGLALEGFEPDRLASLLRRRRSFRVFQRDHPVLRGDRGRLAVDDGRLRTRRPRARTPSRSGRGTSSPCRR